MGHGASVHVQNKNGQMPHQEKLKIHICTFFDFFVKKKVKKRKVTYLSNYFVSHSHKYTCNHNIKMHSKPEKATSNLNTMASIMTSMVGRCSRECQLQ